jgi:predicted nucleic acid-binding Zn ribbon protein
MYHYKKQEPTFRKAETSSLKEAIDELLNAYKLRSKYNETHIVAAWSRIMGPAIANRTSKIFIKNKKLYVQLNSAPLKSELTMSKSKIIEILNKDVQEELLEEVIFL